MIPLWRRHPWLTAGFVLALVAALGFAVLAVLHARRLEHPPLTDIQGWMTPGYVGHGLHLPPEVTARALGIAEGSGKGRTLDEIAAGQGVPLQVLIDRLKAAAAAGQGG